jgi:hypothetical protein
MSLAAVLAAAVIPIGSAHDGVVSDGSLYYLGDRGTVKRLELDTGVKSTVYKAPDRYTHISELEAGGGRLAFETTRRAVRIFAMNDDGTGLKEIARSRAFARDCGGMLRLLDVSPSGKLLYDDVRVRCSTHRGRHKVVAYGSRPRTLVSTPAETLFLTMGPPWRQLVGQQLVTWGDRLVRVRNLASGRTRRFRPPDLRSSFAEPAVAADGRVLLDVYRSMGRGEFPLQTIRLVSASGTSTVVHRMQRVYGQARFCGDRPLLHTFSQRGSLRIRLLEPPVEVAAARLDLDVEASCDATHFVLLTIGRDRGELAYDFALPQ